ncbi:cyclin-dependent kinase inhibitor 1 [Salminus brasiliensis]|uniref:cyclin-dependent kinase inhibitor 1 n=1 Tax=Salminus brasiliensis TaxID=930266 RepID=UPI003B834BA8
MSTVQLPSSGVLGPPASSSSSSSRTFPLIRRDTVPRSRVCRSLFGPVDHDELNREMKAKLREISERDQKRWNFNFGTGQPLPGEYEWEEAPGETSPAFYQECVRAGRSRAVGGSQKPAPLPKEEDSVSCSRDSRVFPENVTENQSSGSGGSGKLTCKTVRRKRPSPLTTTRITDFYVKRRSSDGVKQRERSSRKPFPSVAEEQTPRKQIR